jgi:hypothetical protein
MFILQQQLPKDIYLITQEYHKFIAQPLNRLISNLALQNDSLASRIVSANTNLTRNLIYNTIHPLSLPSEKHFFIIGRPLVV